MHLDQIMFLGVKRHLCVIVLESLAQRTATPENSHQLHEQKKIKGKKSENTNLTIFANCLRPRGRGERDFINQLITGYNFGQYPSLYNQRILEEKGTKGSEFGLETN